MRAVRFETGLIELELSNRIQCKTQPGGSSSYLKLFGKCQVDLNLALGQIVKHQVQHLTRQEQELVRNEKMFLEHFLLAYRCMKKLAQTFTRSHISEPGSGCATLSRRRSVDPPTRRLF